MGYGDLKVFVHCPTTGLSEVVNLYSHSALLGLRGDYKQATIELMHRRGINTPKVDFPEEDIDLLLLVKGDVGPPLEEACERKE